MPTHELKTWSEPFEAMWRGAKTAECRHVRAIIRHDMAGRTTCMTCGAIFPGPLLTGLSMTEMTLPVPDLRGIATGTILVQ